VYAHAVCDGIPFVPVDGGECEVADATEAWWSSGHTSQGHSFRTAWYHSGSNIHYASAYGGWWCGCYNGDLTISGRKLNQLALKAVSHPNWDLSIWVSNQPRRTVFRRPSVKSWL
ncbi:MAG: hypothetical protein ACRD7E_23335, partial [Bryobacteraceae bacterium]